MDSVPSEEKAGVASSATHRRAQKSTTLNRNYVRRPSAKAQSEERAALDSVAQRRAEDLKRRQALAEKINRERLAALRSGRSLNRRAGVEVKDKPEVEATRGENEPQDPLALRANKAKASKTATAKPLSAAIENSLSAKQVKGAAPKRLAQETLESAISSADQIEANDEGGFSARTTFGPKRLALAFACAVLAVGAVAYFISVNTPDLSVRVAAMQSGIDASYPSYVPRGFSLSDIMSESGKISMTFTASDGSFNLSEEKSTWDNATLEANYVKSAWGANYTILREQGLSIYISGSDAAWLNGGILYKIEVSGTTLTKKQLKTIATSL